MVSASPFRGADAAADKTTGGQEHPSARWAARVSWPLSAFGGGTRMHRRSFIRAVTGLALIAGTLAAGAARADTTLLNVSYDPTRELYQEYNAAFARYWKG